MPLIFKIWIALIVITVIVLAIKRKSKPIEDTSFLEDKETEYWDKIKTIKRDIGHRVKPTLPL